MSSNSSPDISTSEKKPVFVVKTSGAVLKQGAAPLILGAWFTYLLAFANVAILPQYSINLGGFLIPDRIALASTIAFITIIIGLIYPSHLFGFRKYEFYNDYLKVNQEGEIPYSKVEVLGDVRSGGRHRRTVGFKVLVEGKRKAWNIPNSRNKHLGLNLRGWIERRVNPPEKMEQMTTPPQLQAPGVSASIMKSYLDFAAMQQQNEMARMSRLPQDITKPQYLILREYGRGFRNPKDIAKRLSIEKKEVERETDGLKSNGYLAGNNKLTGKGLEVLNE